MVRFVLKILYIVDDYEDYVLIYLFSNRQSWIQNSTVIEHAAAKKISILLVQSNHTYDRMGWITLVASLVITIVSGSKGQILIWCLIQLRRWELTPESGTHPWVIRRGTGKWPIEIWFSQRKNIKFLHSWENHIDHFNPFYILETPSYKWPILIHFEDFARIFPEALGEMGTHLPWKEPSPDGAQLMPRCQRALARALTITDAATRSRLRTCKYFDTKNAGQAEESLINHETCRN